MTDPIKFTSQDCDTVIFSCGKCRLVVSSTKNFGSGPGAEKQAFTLAQNHCAPRRCEDCSQGLKSPFVRCSACIEKNRRDRYLSVLESAEHVDVHDGPVYEPWTERYYHTLGDLIDAFENEGAYSGDAVPRYAHPCTEEAPRLDLDDWLEQAEDCLELQEGVEIDWEGYPELKAHVDEFNKLQKQQVWRPTLGKVITITQDLFDEPVVKWMGDE